jgi:4-diphosphocytidyl-2-C-methyl-D-erythritol kinase
VPDGYHELQTVFRLLDWGDEIRLRVRATARSGAGRGARCARTPTWWCARRAAAAACRGVAAGVDIEVEKRIPMGGGLGGGSSDAATVLVALNLLWKLDLDEDVLAELGRQLGADVPVFVRGRSAWAEGIGEQLTPLDLPSRHYVVLDPHESVPTAALFQAPELTRNAPRATISSFASGETTENAFAPVVRARHPRVAAALDWLSQLRSGTAFRQRWLRVSGSEVIRSGNADCRTMSGGIHGASGRGCRCFTLAHALARHRGVV